MFSAEDLKAIGWYARDKGYKPQLSTIGGVNFTDSAGKPVTVQLKDIHSAHQGWKVEDQRRRRNERARERRAEQLAEKKRRAAV